jgi:DNA-binding MarR family transcriptional regulator
MLDTREFKSQRSRYAAERIDLLAANRRSEPILLELVLRIQGDLRRALAPIGVTPLQAGVLCYLRQHADAWLIDAAKAFRLEPPTLTDVVQDLVRKGWITNRRSIEDRRAICLKLSRKGEALVRRIAPIVEGVEAMLREQKRDALGISTSMTSSLLSPLSSITVPS